MTGDDIRRLREERADVFKRLLAVPSSKLDVNLARLRVLLSMLRNAGNDPELVSFVVETALHHVEALGQANAISANAAARFDALRIEACLSDEALNRYHAAIDRIVIIDREYRYLFANQANAKLHGFPSGAFVGRPLWSVVTEAFFERINKPMYDRCFEGSPSGAVSFQPGRPDIELYSAHIDPVFDDRQHVVAALAVVRRINIS